MYKSFAKINLLGYLLNRLIYKVKVGSYVNFLINGKITLHHKNIVIRDFTEIIVSNGGKLELKEGVFIGRSVEIGANNIFIDNNSSIQNNCILLGNVIIGKNCLLASNVYVSSGKHHFKYMPELLIHDQDNLARLNNLDQSNLVEIEDDVWIGKNVVIMSGVTIGKGSVIGANSFINKNVLPYTVVVGSPQKVVSKRLHFFDDMPDILDGTMVESFPYFYKGVDYSILTIKAHKYPLVIDEYFILSLRNKNNLSYLVIDFVLDSDVVFEYENQNIKATVSNNIVKFKVAKSKDDKYQINIKNTIKTIQIKKVFFCD